MEVTNVLVLMAICLCIAHGSELRNLSKGVKAFYDLADSELGEQDFWEIMEYLDQRFHRKCFSVENIITDIRTNDILDVVGNLESTMNRFSLEMVEDRARFQNRLSDMEAVIEKLTTDTVGDRARFRNEIFDLQKHFMAFQNESKLSEDMMVNKYVRSDLFCQTQEYQKCLAGHCCIDTIATFQNLALGKQARQSSDYDVRGAKYAVDGSRATIIHTKYEAAPWWRVDLAAIRSVSRVVIVNRQDGWWDRLRNVVVTVSSNESDDGSICGKFDGPGTAGQIIEINCAEKLYGRYVKLTMNSANYLHVSEVEVYSQK